jgi:hypothetical protein
MYDDDVTGNNITCTTHFNYRIAATLHSLDTYIFLSNVSVNALHEGQNEK